MYDPFLGQRVNGVRQSWHGMPHIRNPRIILYVLLRIYEASNGALYWRRWMSTLNCKYVICSIESRYTWSHSVAAAIERLHLHSTAPPFLFPRNLTVIYSYTSSWTAARVILEGTLPGFYECERHSRVRLIYEKNFLRLKYEQKRGLEQKHEGRRNTRAPCEDEGVEGER